MTLTTGVASHRGAQPRKHAGVAVWRNQGHPNQIFASTLRIRHLWLKPQMSRSVEKLNCAKVLIII
jgi:hypothetical protein